jgi:hypothetical protein
LEISKIQKEAAAATELAVKNSKLNWQNLKLQNIPSVRKLPKKKMKSMRFADVFHNRL